MGEDTRNSATGLCLLANGSAGRWDIAIDESVGRENGRFVEIEGPGVYLVFQVRDLKTISEAMHFLQSHCTHTSSRYHAKSACDNSLTLGKFGTATVSLLWDNEEAPRCFFVIAPKAKSTIRLSLEEEDIRNWIEALRQVLQDLPQSVE